jgi:hypothetical protein
LLRCEDQTMVSLVVDTEDQGDELGEQYELRIELESQ